MSFFLLVDLALGVAENDCTPAGGLAVDSLLEASDLACLRSQSFVLYWLYTGKNRCASLGVSLSSFVIKAIFSLSIA